MNDINFNTGKIAGGTDRVFCVKCRRLRIRGGDNICKFCLEEDNEVQV